VFVYVFAALGEIAFIGVLALVYSSPLYFAFFVRVIFRGVAFLKSAFAIPALAV
jgi:hypothetical protein